MAQQCIIHFLCVKYTIPSPLIVIWPSLDCRMTRSPFTRPWRKTVKECRLRRPSGNHKLGADASAAAGPKGRAAAADTDIVMRAEILSYSRSRGLFAGISLEGSTLRSDGSANKKLYGRTLSAKEIVREGKVGVPASGRELISLLDKQSPKNESDPVSLKE